MVLIIRKIIAVLGVLGLLAASATQAQEGSTLARVQSSGKLRVAIIGGNPPYSIISPSGDPQGYDIDIANKLAASLGAKPEFVITDIPGRVVALQTGRADVTIANFTKTEERSKVISFTDPYVVVGIQFAVLASRTDINRIDDLNHADKRVAVTRGGSMTLVIPQVLPQADMVTFDNLNDTLLALRSNQVDAISQDNLYTADLLNKNPGRYKVLPGIYSKEDISIGVGQGDSAWLEQINRWMGEFNRSGENNTTFKQWFGYDLPTVEATR